MRGNTATLRRRNETRYRSREDRVSGEGGMALLDRRPQMTPHRFPGYGLADGVTIILERITHWWPIDYNGNCGTEIALDTGKSVRVGVYPSDVEKVVRDACSRRVD